MKLCPMIFFFQCWDQLQPDLLCHCQATTLNQELVWHSLVKFICNLFTLWFLIGLNVANKASNQTGRDEVMNLPL